MPIINPSPGSTTIIQTTIQGSPGLDGDPGEDSFPLPGSPGPQGSQGVPGINGSQGISGEDGIDGDSSFIPGPQGIQGIQGSPGIQGLPGVTVFVEDGLTGEDGFPGVPGPAGAQGTNGTIGRDGARGLDGEDGLVSDDLWPGFNPFIDDPLEQISRIQDRNNTILPNYSALVVGPYTINSGKKLTIGSGGRFKIEQGAPDSPARVSAQQTSTYTFTLIGSEFMVGLGADKSTQIVTPKVSGNLLVTFYGSVTLTAQGAFGQQIKVFYGIGTPPSTGSASPPIPGTQVGTRLKFDSSLISTLAFSISVLVTRLVVGTAYWFDLSHGPIPSASITGTVNEVNFTAIEL